MYYLYIFITLLLTPFMYCWALYRLYKGKEDKARITERFAITKQKRPNGNLIWFHAASVGESLALLSLLNMLVEKTDYNILLTTYTYTSSKLIKEKFPSRIIHQFLPYDSPIFARKMVNHWRPDLVLWTESDFWPNILTCLARNSKLVLLNSRMSEKSFAKWKRFPGFIKYILSLFVEILPQSANDYQKMKELGATRLKYIGNLKYCSSPTNFDEELVAIVAKHIKGRKIIFIASTHKGEESLILDSLKQLIKNQEEILVFLAPRHPVRTEEVICLLDDSGLSYVQRSKSCEIKQDTNVFLIDSLGEMNNFFKLSDITIMGGSFVNIGGHNIIEPAKHENVIITGPYMSNFTEVLDEFVAAKAVIKVKDAKELAGLLEKLLNDKKEMKEISKNALKIAGGYEEILPNVFNYISSIIKPD